MLEELDMLEAKLAQLLDRHQAVREENLRLRQQLAELEQSNTLMSDRLAEARGRLEALYNQLPD